MDQLPQEWPPEFGNNPADLRVVREGFNSLEDFGHEAQTNLRHALFLIPELYLLKIAHRGLGQADDESL